MAIVGTLIPWLFLGAFFLVEGLNVPFFVQFLFVNGAATGFSANVVITIIVFWVWSWNDAAKNGVASW